MVIYYHHVRFYIMKKGGNILVEVVQIVHSFSYLFLDSFAVLIEGMIISDFFLHSVGKGTQEFTKTKDVNSTFVAFLMILHTLSKINGIFVAKPLCKNHRSRARTANRKWEEVCLHPAPRVGSQRLLLFFKETLGLLLCCILTVYTIQMVVGGQALYNLLIIVKT